MILFFKTLICTYLSLLFYFLPSICPLFFSPFSLFLSCLFISSYARSNFSSLSFLYIPLHPVFQFSIPLPDLYLLNLSRCFVCSPRFSLFVVSVCLRLSRFIWGFHARGKCLRHFKPSTPHFLPSFLLFSSLIPSLVFHFPNLFPALILILLWFFWPNFL